MVKVFFPPFSRVCFLLWGFNGYNDWIIQLKELHFLSGALRKGDKGFKV